MEGRGETTASGREGLEHEHGKEVVWMNEWFEWCVMGEMK